MLFATLNPFELSNSYLTKRTFCIHNKSMDQPVAPAPQHETAPPVQQETAPVKQETLPKAPNRTLILVAVGIGILLFGIGTFFLVGNRSTSPSTKDVATTSPTPIPSTPTPTIVLKEEYANPFDQKSSYQNPFGSSEEYQNPFDTGR